ncbi:hypothetical protein LQF67_01630 [Tetragenococcus halophilus]|uniref:hypothetical protein n=1 Tax=Tetragenococcus halophilus TaxID=51669 RepID=UPI001F1A01CF|nr:hypothetical protein [Tetragenococcus halophilus]MCF1684278.1 hypothetical protein [Tetragenococcus halophilus]
MSLKIESSAEEIRNWITEEEVYDLLDTFGFFDDDEYKTFSNKTSAIPLNKTTDEVDDKKIQKPKLNFIIENNNFSFAYKNFDTYIEAA